MCSGSGAPGISTTFRGKSGMSDTVALLTLAARILYHRRMGAPGYPLRGIVLRVDGRAHAGRVALVTGGGRRTGAAAGPCGGMFFGWMGGPPGGGGALVPGGGRGIGAATARLLAGQGAAVAV